MKELEVADSALGQARRRYDNDDDLTVKGIIYFRRTVFFSYPTLHCCTIISILPRSLYRSHLSNGSLFLCARCMDTYGCHRSGT